jgi:nitrogen fixation protein NifU and related proteins
VSGQRRPDDPSASGGKIPDEKVRRRCAELLRAGGFDADDPWVGTGQADAEGGGDRIRIQIRVPEGGMVREARFKAFGCPSSIAAASLVTEWLEGRSLSAALDIRSADIAAELELPTSRLASARLAERAARAAVADVRRKLEIEAGKVVTGRSDGARIPGGQSRREEASIEQPGGSE